MRTVCCKKTTPFKVKHTKRLFKKYVLLYNPSGLVVQWLEPTAHNGVVVGSNPTKPTLISCWSNNRIDWIVQTAAPKDVVPSNTQQAYHATGLYLDLKNTNDHQ
jgi:hypothetical protein